MARPNETVTTTTTTSTTASYHHICIMRTSRTDTVQSTLRRHSPETTQTQEPLQRESPIDHTGIPRGYCGSVPDHLICHFSTSGLDSTGNETFYMSGLFPFFFSFPITCFPVHSGKGFRMAGGKSFTRPTLSVSPRYSSSIYCSRVKKQPRMVMFAPETM